MIDATRRLAVGVARRPLSAAALAGVFLAVAGSAYLLWIRDSSLFGVDHVRVVGLHSPERARVRRALDAAARDMTTLHVKMGDLKDAVREFPVVKSLAVDTDFPSTMTIRVTENVPVAIVRAGGRQLPVTEDGQVIDGLPLRDRNLPTLRSKSPVLLRVLGAAPPALLRRASKAFVGPRGIVVLLRHGPRLYFYGADRAALRWRAVARVLADPKTGQSAYVDLQLPSRPALGGTAAPATTPSPAPAGEAPPAPAPAVTPSPSPTPAAPAPTPASGVPTTP
jgi:cell division septal protein FtsQ